MKILRVLALVLALAPAVASGQSASIPTPEEHFGHRIGADRELVSWAELVDYLKLVGDRSPRVRVREIGPTTAGRPFVLVEVSSERTMADIDRYRDLQRRLYFQDHAPGTAPEAAHTEAEREEIFREGKAVVLITCTIHATEVGAAQMSLELVHELATDRSERLEAVLDDVILLLVPSMNPDGQAMIADWYDAHVGTEHEASPIPWLYHPYVGHDNNRDMYMYTQAETRHVGQILYEEWFPSIWLDEHQMGSSGPRIFTMPATDPININVHPLIYRLNGFYGQAQAAALEAAGKIGIVYDQTYTNYWEGALAWTGWWHNQVGMLTEVASARIATPLEQRLAKLGEAPSGAPEDFQAARRRMMEHPEEPLPPPRDVQPRTSYPRPWLGGTWRLRDIVDYELVVTHALLETASSTRRRLLEQIYEVNRTTIAQFLNGGSASAPPDGYGTLPEAIEPERDTGRVMAGSMGPPDTPYAIVVPADGHDPPTTRKMLRLLERGGVVVERASARFEAGGRSYPEGTFVIRLAQVFGRYAKDMLERQRYPEVRRAPNLPPEPPYDVTAWSLGLQMGVETRFVEAPFEASLEKLESVPLPEGGIEGSGSVYVLDAAYNDAFALVNRLGGAPARIRRAARSFSFQGRRLPAGSWVFDRADGSRLTGLARELGVVLQAGDRAPEVEMVDFAPARIALYQPWGSNMDEGWTRWLLDEFGYDYVTLHPQDFRGESIPEAVRAEWPAHVAAHAPEPGARGPLADRFDVLVFTHQEGDDIVDGDDYAIIPPDYRGGIGQRGLEAVWDFVASGKTVVALGDATGLFIDRWPLPVRNAVADLDRDAFLIPGSILKIQSDPSHPLAWGMPRDAHGYFIRSPAFDLTEGFASQRATIAVRYPNDDLNASGWTRGEEHVQGRAAAVEVDFEGGGRLVLLGLRPQHRAQTHATFKLLFNALALPR